MNKNYQGKSQYTVELSIYMLYMTTINYIMIISTQRNMLRGNRATLIIRRKKLSPHTKGEICIGLTCKIAFKRRDLRKKSAFTSLTPNLQLANIFLSSLSLVQLYLYGIALSVTHKGERYFYFVFCFLHEKMHKCKKLMKII